MNRYEIDGQRGRHIARNMVILGVSILFLTAFFSVTKPSLLSSNVFAVPITGWAETSPLPSAIAGWNAVYHDEHVYLLGGRDSTGQPTAKVYMAKLSPSGPLEVWGETTPLPIALFLHAVAADDRYVYAVGGWSGDVTKLQTAVWRAPFLAGGGLGSWVQISTFPTKIDLQGAVIVNNRLYIIGGWNGSSAINDIYYADIVPGGIGVWTSETVNPLVIPLRRHAVVAHNGYIYVTGGFSSGTLSSVYVSKVNPDGSLQPWKTTTPLPGARYYHRAVIHDDQLTILGGTDGASEFSTVIQAAINPDGTLGGWVTQPSLPLALNRFGAAVVSRYGSEYIFVVGGLNNGTTQSKTYHSLPPPTPTPTPEATPTPFASVSFALENNPKHWVAPGEIITYTFSYRNNGPATISNAIIQDAIPANTEILPESVIPTGAINVADEQEIVTWNLGELAADTGDTVSYQVRRVTPTPISSVPGPLGITIFGPTSGSSGEKLDYRIEVTNRVNIELTEIEIRAAVPAGATFVEGSSGTNGSLENGVIKWNFASIQGDSVNSVHFSLISNSTLVQSNYEVKTAAGQRGIGSKVLVTVIDNLPPPATGDGVMIINDGASITWQIGDISGETKANSVRNPALQNIYLPLAARP